MKALEAIGGWLLFLGILVLGWTVEIALLMTFFPPKG